MGVIVNVPSWNFFVKISSKKEYQVDSTKKKIKILEAGRACCSNYLYRQQEAEICFQPCSWAKGLEDSYETSLFNFIIFHVDNEMSGCPLSCF